MRPIPSALRKQIAADPFMEICIHKKFRPAHACSGPLQWEHAHRYAGRQINEWWAIVPCCESMNVGVTGLSKEFNQYVALLRAKKLNIDLAVEYPKKNWDQLFDSLHDKFWWMFIDRDTREELAEVGQISTKQSVWYHSSV